LVEVPVTRAAIWTWRCSARRLQVARRHNTSSCGLGLGLSIMGRLSERLEIGENGARGTDVRMLPRVAEQLT
jgi:hypothetical protein